MAKSINENQLAQTITRHEGGKKATDIGQVKEILRVTLDVLANGYLPSQILELIERHRD